MKAAFCSLATGDSYVKSAINLHNNIRSKTTDSVSLIATDCLSSIPEYFTSVTTEGYPIRSKSGAWYNYNLKFLPIKKSIELNKDYIIFIDADWDTYTHFHEDKFNLLFTEMEDNNIDFVFERPHNIGISKKNWDNCFWRHKIKPYRLDVIDDYDAGHVCNEQILVFKNNEKLKIFIDFWEKLFWQSHNEEIWAFAEGVEIGMSSVVANLNWNYNLFGCLRDCFHFYDIAGNHWVRF